MKRKQTKTRRLKQRKQFAHCVLGFIDGDVDGGDGNGDGNGDGDVDGSGHVDGYGKYIETN